MKTREKKKRNEISEAGLRSTEGTEMPTLTCPENDLTWDASSKARRFSPDLAITGFQRDHHLHQGEGEGDGEAGPRRPVNLEAPVRSCAPCSKQRHRQPGLLSHRPGRPVCLRGGHKLAEDIGR